MGAVADEGPFYYRVQSPVVLIEFDHHPGVVFDNLVPAAITFTPWYARPTGVTTASTCFASTTTASTTAPESTSPGHNTWGFRFIHSPSPGRRPALPGQNGI